MVKQYSNMLKYMLFDVAPCRKDQSYKEPNNAMRPREVRLQKRPRGLGLKCHFPNNQLVCFIFDKPLTEHCHRGLLCCIIG